MSQGGHVFSTQPNSIRAQQILPIIITSYREFSSKPLMGQTLETKPRFRDHKESVKRTCHRYSAGVYPGSERGRGLSL